MSRTPTLDQCLGAIADLSREELVERWIKTYKHPPPKGIKRGLLERSIAYQIQAKRFGRLKPELTKRLVAIAGDEGVTGSGASPTVELQPGTRLMREWHGKTHEVNVTQSGYDWQGDEYRSLSAVARAITGARWSGPRFFGLQQ